MGETASSGSAQGAWEPFAYTPDGVMEEGTRRFREQWPEKWEAWLRFCEREDAAADLPTVAGTSGVLSEADALVDAFEKRRGESMFTADRNLLRDTAATMLAATEARVRAEVAAAIEAVGASPELAAQIARGDA